MKNTKKITLFVPEDLLERAQAATGEGISATIKRGLENIAASDAFEKLLKMRGKVKTLINLKELREDR